MNPYKKNKITSISDLPFNEEYNDFGTDRYVNGLIRFIESSSAPITIALQGEWGSGKTSLMTRLERVLCSSNKAPFIGVNINTWEYSMMSSPEITVFKILAKLVHELTGANPDSKKKTSKLLRALYRGGREFLKMMPGVNVAMEMANVPTDLSFEENEVSLSELREELQQAIKNRLLETKQRGVIIFVDDLDRLNPPVAVEILELLKNVFTLDRCIFVLAIDYDVVVKGLKPKFGELTDKNEREFRSFFDKIIQVPFSLPVNHYRPMGFVLQSLVDIGYLKEFDTGNPHVRSQFETVVKYSVGKNPRSIKRLINTLSLLDCIAQCGETTERNGVEDSIDDKLLNFITVSIQICYPKIYRMLSHNPEFTRWNEAFARKMGINMDDDESNGESDVQWEDVLEAACKPDSYLTKHLNDITTLLNLIIDILGKTNQAGEGQLGKKMQTIIDKSSFTGINSGFNAEDLKGDDLIDKLHRNVIRRIKEKQPEIGEIKPKRNTGNGGLFINIDKKRRFEVVFTPSINEKKQIALRIWPKIAIKRPERLKGKSFEEMMKDETLANELSHLDSTLCKFLGKDTWFFEGKTFEGQSTFFPSYREELEYIHRKGWLSKEITNDPQFWINLDKPSHFEEEKIVDTIADVILATYNFRKAMKNWE